MTADVFSWEVELPQRGARASLGGRPPRARLRLSSREHGEEAISLPVAVGRRLEALGSEGAAAPSCRAELLHLLGELSRSCAHARMEELVGRRDYSRSELAERLARDGYRDEVAHEIVDRACEVGIVDDARYGAAFARSKALNGWGRLKVERELARRGVDAAAIPGWPDEFFSADEERERALSLASRRRVTGKNDYQKLVRFLCARGFSMGLSASVAREVLSSDDSLD